MSANRKLSDSWRKTDVAIWPVSGGPPRPPGTLRQLRAVTNATTPETQPTRALLGSGAVAQLLHPLARRTEVEVAEARLPDAARKVKIPTQAKGAWVGHPAQFKLSHYRQLSFPELRQGRSDQGSSPCSTQRRSPSQTPPSSRYRHRPPQLPGVGSSNRRQGRHEYRST